MVPTSYAPVVAHCNRGKVVIQYVPLMGADPLGGDCLLAVRQNVMTNQSQEGGW